MMDQDVHDLLCWNSYIRSSGTGLWQPEPGRNSKEDGEQQVGSSNETNVTKPLKSREIGLKPLFPTRTLRNRALAELLKDRWQCADGLTVFEDATEILDRRLYRWEGEALSHLLDIESRRVRSTEENKQLANFISEASHHECPIGFTDILEVLHINGIDFNRHNESRVNVLVTIFVNKSFGKDVEEAIRFLAGHGLDLIESGQAALMEFCRGFKDFAYHIGMSCLLKVLEMLVRLGFSLDDESRRGSLVIFLRGLSTGVDENGHVAEIYKFFIDNGFGIDGAFEAICSYETLLECMRYAETFDSVLATFHLLHTSSSTTMHFENDEEKQDMLRLFSKDWCEREDLTLWDLIRRSIDVGIHSKDIDGHNTNLLMAVSEYYKGKELPDVVELLCKSGVEVNHLNVARNNALFSLTGNEPNSRQAVYEAARVLLENGIDINHEQYSGQNALLSFFSKQLRSRDRCCRYQKLLDLNHLHFWDTLNLLLDSGIRVNHISSETSEDTLLLQILASLADRGERWINCVHSPRSYYPLTDTLIERDPIYFQGALDFIKRLLDAGASTKEKFDVESDSVLFYVCAEFKGYELVALVKLLCEYGVDVNATTSRYTSVAERLNAMDVLRRFNSWQVSVFPKVEEILKLHGFKE